MPENKKTIAPAEILAIALSKEKDAFAFYGEIEKSSTVVPVKELAARLKEEEQRHIRMIERQLQKIRLG